MTITEKTETTVKIKGILLRRRTETGPRGGQRHIYQSAKASPDWGYWYETARQAISQSNESDRVVR